MPVPESPRELTPDWITAALTESGVLQGGVVTSAKWERVGQEYGFTGLIGRVSLRYERAVGDPPASLIAKLPMATGDVVSGYRALQERDPSLRQRYYDRCVSEVRFYREIGAPFAPECYYSAFDDTDRRVVLLLEDVAGGRQGDVLDGCSIDDAALVIDELAPFHARWWGERAPADSFPRSRGDPGARQERYARCAIDFVARHGDGLPSGVRSVVELLRSRLARVIVALEEAPQTLTHADLHLDNLIFNGSGSGRSVVVLDWQTTSVGAPAWDLVFILFGSLMQDDRRAAEDVLLDRYAELLAAHGADYSGEGLRLDCRLALLALFAGTIVWVASVDPSEMLERERALQQAAIADSRLMSAVLDHDVAALLERLEPLNL
jgi:hypothetical protein